MHIVPATTSRDSASLGVRYYLDPDPETGEVTKVYEVSELIL